MITAVFLFIKVSASPIQRKFAMYLINYSKTSKYTEIFSHFIVNALLYVEYRYEYAN